MRPRGDYITQLYPPSRFHLTVDIIIAAMPPRPTLRPNGKSKMTLADKVRLEWARFDVWLESQRKDVDDRRGEKSLQELRQCMEATKRSLPKGFHPTLMKEYENEKYMIVNDREERAVLVMRSRVEWEERLQKAGLGGQRLGPYDARRTGGC